LPIRPDSRRPQHTIETDVPDYIVSGANRVKGRFVADAFSPTNTPFIMLQFIVRAAHTSWNFF
jgi:hypothetical protein